MKHYTVRFCQECGRNKRFYYHVNETPEWTDQRCNSGHLLSLDVQALQEIFKTVFHPVIADWINNSNPLSKVLKNESPSRM